MFDMFISAFSSACSMEALVANFIGVALGIVFGALPGLTAVMGVALLIPLTFGFPAVIAFSALLGHVLRRNLRGQHHRHPRRHSGHGGRRRDHA